jgi:hypothetical protein
VVSVYKMNIRMYLLVVIALVDPVVNELMNVICAKKLSRIKLKFIYENN